MPVPFHSRLGRASLIWDTVLTPFATTLLVFTSPSHAQTIDFAPSTTSFSPLFSIPPTSSGPAAAATPSTESRSHTTLFSSIPAHNATTNNASSTSTQRGSLPLGPANGDPMQTGESTGGGLLNYYFAFLAVFVVLLFLGVWYIHRRKKRMKALRASSRQNALSRDLDGWAGGRRWVGGAFRGGLRRQQEREQHSREEGLNELGEAPPPYKARASVTSVEGAPTEQRTDSAHVDGPSQPTIPLRTLHRNGQSFSPPGYDEAFRPSPLDIAETNSTAPRNGFTRTNTVDHPGAPGS